MQKRLLLLLGLVLMMSLTLIGCAAQGSITPTDSTSQQAGIWVSGTGDVTVTPDIAVLTLGVEAQGATVQEAQVEAISAMNAVINALKSNGVADADIQTQWYNISSITSWDSEKREQITTGYRVTNMVTAKIREIDKTGIIIDAVAVAGGDAARINGVSFSVDDPSAYTDQALEDAMQKASAKAQKLAELAGVTLGKVVYISESGVSTPYIYRSIAAYDSAGSTPISPGEMEISLTVQVGYAID